MTCAQFEVDCIGSRSMAEAHEDDFKPDAGTRPQLPSGPDPARRFGRLWTALAYASLVVLGIWLGHLMEGGAAVADATPPPAAARPVVVTTVPAPAPESCIRALRRSDATIMLLARGVRDRRLSEMLKSYVNESRTCREEVSAR
jgi:hypothetical protein